MLDPISVVWNAEMEEIDVDQQVKQTAYKHKIRSLKSSFLNKLTLLQIGRFNLVPVLKKIQKELEPLLNGIAEKQRNETRLDKNDYALLRIAEQASKVISVINAADKKMNVGEWESIASALEEIEKILADNFLNGFANLSNTGAINKVTGKIAPDWTWNTIVQQKKAFKNFFINYANNYKRWPDRLYGEHGDIAIEMNAMIKAVSENPMYLTQVLVSYENEYKAIAETNNDAAVELAKKIGLIQLAVNNKTSVENLPEALNEININYAKAEFDVERKQQETQLLMCKPMGMMMQYGFLG